MEKPARFQFVKTLTNPSRRPKSAYKRRGIQKQTEKKANREEESKKEKKRETLAKVQVIQSRRTLKLQLCLVRSEGKEEGMQY